MKAILIALAAGATLVGAVPAAARDGCGPNGYRNQWGHCRYDREYDRGGRGYDRGWHRGYDRDRRDYDRRYERDGVDLIIGNWYDGRGYWDGHRYWQHRRHRETGWSYY